MKYAVYQMDIIAGDPQANRDQVCRWFADVVAVSQPDVVVLPEMWTTAYTLPELEHYADEMCEPTLRFLQSLATTYHVHIIGGSVANQKSTGFYNTALVVHRDGECVYAYDKIHLVPMLDEPAYLTGGQEKAEVFMIDEVKMGVVICYDLRFPELIRGLALSGVQVLHVVAEWPEARRYHWRSLIIARAIENQMYVVACNRVGAYNGQSFAGDSLIVDPWGDVVQEAGLSHEETLTASINVDQIPDIRRRVPVFSSRVPTLYD